MSMTKSFILNQRLPLPQSSIFNGVTTPSVNSKEYNVWSSDDFSKHADDGGCVIPTTSELIYTHPIQPWKSCLISSNYLYNHSNYLNYFCQDTSRGDDLEEAFDNMAYDQQREQMEHSHRLQVQQQQQSQAQQVQRLQIEHEQDQHIQKPRNTPHHLTSHRIDPTIATASTSSISSQLQPQHAPLIGTSKTPSRKPTDQKRQPIACFNCRQRRLKCDGENPCSPCVRRGVTETCAFAQQVRRRGPGRKKLAQLASLGDVDAANALGIQPGDWVRDPELYPPSPKRKRND